MEDASSPDPHTLFSHDEAPKTRSRSRVLSALGASGTTLPNVRLEKPEAAGSGAFPVGRYQNASEIARGGMGAILKAEDPDLNRTVAIKVLLGGTRASEVLLSKFILEAQVTGQLEHPHIVPVHELGLDDAGSPYFTMKRVQGTSLQEVLAGLKRRGRSRTLSIRTRLLADFLKICDGVAFAHSRGVVHRDLKPANVMLGEYGEVLVMDWGLAKVRGNRDQVSGLRSDSAEPQQTMEGTVMGTPAYMPPEQAEGRIDEIDEASDVYSLGAILYEILTLEAPFGGGNSYQILERVRRGAFVPPGERARDLAIPRELDAVVVKAMALEKGDRYERVLDLKADVQAFLDGRILVAASYNPVQRAAKWVRRHRAVAVAAAAVFLVVAGAIGWVAWREARETSRRETAWRGQVEGLQADLRMLERTLDETGGATLRLANDELDDAAIERWFAARDQAAGILDRLATLHGEAPDEATRRAVDLETIRAVRTRVCRSAWTKACELDLYPMAQSWLARAALTGEEREAAAEEVRTIRDDRIAKGLAEAGRLREEALVQVSKWKPDDWRRSAVDRLFRKKSPALVRLLLGEDYLGSPEEPIRLLAIEALGRFGDPRTETDDGLDAVEALCAQLLAIDPETAPQVARALAEALRSLADPRTFEILGEWLIDDEGHGPTRRSAIGILASVPIPASMEDRGENAPDEPAEFLRRANLFMARQLWDRAASDLGRVLDAAPDHVTARILRSRTWMERGDPAAALADLDRAVADHPDSAPALHERAKVHARAQRWSQALADAERAVAIDPSNASYVHARGENRFELKQYEGALADCREALRLRPSLHGAHIVIGRILWGQNQLDGALAEFTQAITLDPGHASEAYLYRGLLHKSMGHPEEALRDFTRCVEINGSHVSAFFQRGQVHEEARRFAEALVDYETCTRHRPDFWQAWFCAGRVHAALGRRDEARKALETAAAKAPADVRPQIEAALAQLGR